jgi:pimeloyl-ACP methyl ester carboxylesterase
VVGFSEGGILAQYLALRHPEVVSSLALIASVFTLEGNTPPYMRPGNPFYDWAKSVHAERSPDGPGHYDVVAERVHEMWAGGEPNLTVEDLRRIRCRTLVIGGDRDPIVPRAATLATFDAIPDAQLAIVPGTTHGVPFERPALVAQLIREFVGA